MARGLLETQVHAELLIRELRIDAQRAAVDRVHEAGGTREAAEAAAVAEASAWQCAVDGHRIFGSAVGAYVDAIWVEQQTGGEFSFELMQPFLQRVLDAYRATASCVESRGGSLPVPDFLNLIPPVWGLGGGDDG